MEDRRYVPLRLDDPNQPQPMMQQGNTEQFLQRQHPNVRVINTNDPRGQLRPTTWH
jgi:hypothetical protein